MRSSLLERRTSLSTSSTLSASQLQLDAAVTTLSEEVSHPLSIAAMVAGGFAFRGTHLLLSRFASPLLAESGLFTRALAQTAIRGLSLGTEVATFRSISQGPSHVFEGQGFATDYLSFGILKGVGRLAQGQNPIMTHFLQSAGMVSGQNLAYGFGLATQPQGTLIEQFAHAEATNIKLGLGMSLVGIAAPGLSRMERSLDLQNEILSSRSKKAAANIFSIGRESPLAPMASANIAPAVLLGTPKGEIPLDSVAVNRDHLPDREYFVKNGPRLSLSQRAGYARSHRRHATIGDNSHHTLWTPFRRSDDYSPNGGGQVERMNADPSLVDTLTPKWNSAAVFSPSTAVLGFGAALIAKDYVLRAIHGQPIMVGKKWHFEQDGIVNTSALCGTIYFSKAEVAYLNGLTPDEAIEQARIMRAEKFAHASLVFGENFGFRNYEDVAGPDEEIMSAILEPANAHTRSAFWYDDRQGTGVITMAGELSWLELSSGHVPGRRIENIRGMFSGAGAGARGVYDENILHGAQAKNLLASDRKGVLFEGRPDIAKDAIKKTMSEGIPEGTTFEAFADGADFWINLGSPDIFTEDLEWTRRILLKMGPHPLIGLLTNPESGLTAEWILSIRPDAYIVTGNQEFIKSVGYVIANNFGAFTYTGRGSLWAGATRVTPRMTVAAARGAAALAKLGPPPELRDKLPRHMKEFGRGYMIPPPNDIQLLEYEAKAVALAAIEDGVSVFLGANPTEQAVARFRRDLDDKVRWTTALILEERERLEYAGPRYFQVRFQDRYAPFALREGEAPEYDVVPEIDRPEYEYYAQRIGVRQLDRQSILTPAGEVQTQALTQLLVQLRSASVAETLQARLAFKELTAITHITTICPALGLALARRRTLMLPEDLEKYPTVFQDDNVVAMIRQVIPEIVDEITRTFPTVPRVTPE